MKVIAIIPARMNSSRFPGKPLAKINNKEMIKVVYENVSKSNLLNKVVVATCDKEIYNFTQVCPKEMIDKLENPISLNPIIKEVG